MSEVDRYLDELFDRLAGTGAAGRRALSETEDHLRESVTSATAQGIPAQQAEHDAVRRFGSPSRIARQLRLAHRGAWLPFALSRAVLLAGLMIGALSLSFLIDALIRAAQHQIRGERYVACDHLQSAHLPTNLGPHSVSCSNNVAIMRQAAVAGLALLVLAILVLLGRRVAARFITTVPVGRRFTVVASLLFALAAVASFLTRTTSPGTFLLVRDGEGVHAFFVNFLVMLTASIAFAVWGAIRSPST